MKVHLLYEDREWKNVARYRDAENMIQDLGLKTLFSIAGRDIVYEEGSVKGLTPENPFLVQTMKYVMMVPLASEKELMYRQEMVQVALRNEKFIRAWYADVDEMLQKWDALGRKVSGKNLLYHIHVLKLFVTSLSEMKRQLGKEIGRFGKDGFRRFYECLCMEFSEEKEAALNKLLEDITFFTNDYDMDDRYCTEVRSKVVLGCQLSEGLKCTDIVLEEIGTELKKVRVYNNIFGQKSKTISTQKNPKLMEQSLDMRTEAVRYVIAVCKPFVESFEDFWDQLHFQLGFFHAAAILRQHIWRHKLPFCYPKVSEQDILRFTDLKEFVMAVEQMTLPIGNTCDISDKMLLVITGANQGGKSTFLRSIGIAQIMMQCGLPVTASQYESGIFPSFFTHFTRREDSAMNSGRLDEELNRMSQIVDHLEPNAMLLLNESFATTTEKEGSVIAYDIIKALTEAGVKVLTVTHLLSFAQQVYAEAQEANTVGVEFLSAERGANGERTYHMIQHEPELTSFGMDLYEEIIGEN